MKSSIEPLRKWPEPRAPTMIAGTVAERLYFESAIFADKGIIIFLESFLLHKMPPTEYAPRHGGGLGDFRVRTAFDEGHPNFLIIAILERACYLSLLSLFFSSVWSFFRKCWKKPYNLSFMLFPSEGLDSYKRRESSFI